ncbi:PEP/pyruvate-binding domain-containing protein [Nonomuraea sp. NPDC005983]|uniref:PEP/pyruvate-binding domain-containing protein n=1 Tax=Nonomuraea sp. NPDC005983 TaxID=3155595 RepID=UPI00339F7EDB
MNYVVALSEIGLGQVPRVGRKAVLGELRQAGFPVPDGFVVTTDALEAGLAGTEVPLPEGLAADLAAGLDRLGGGPVAVRSSSVAEDLPGMSYAGQYGLGDRLMSGEATADEWTVRDGQAEHRSGGEQALTPEQAREVAALALRVAERMGGPQDIEWVIDDDRLWLVQARPITGLPGEAEPLIPVPIEAPPGFSTRDRNTDRPWVPLQRSLFMPVFSACARHVFAFSTGVVPSAHAIGGWTYVTTPTDTIGELVARVEKIAVAVEDGEPERLIHQWNDETKPRVAAELAELRAVELPSLPDELLTAHLSRLLDLFGSLHEMYFRVTGAAVFLFGRLGVACEDLLGWDVPRTLRLRGGLAGDHVPATSELGELARTAAARPAARAAVETATPDAAAGWPPPACSRGPTTCSTSSTPTRWPPSTTGDPGTTWSGAGAASTPGRWPTRARRATAPRPPRWRWRRAWPRPPPEPSRSRAPCGGRCGCSAGHPGRAPGARPRRGPCGASRPRPAGTRARRASSRPSPTSASCAAATCSSAPRPPPSGRCSSPASARW